MKARSGKRLNLSRETLRTLTPQQLGRVAGGLSGGGASDACSDPCADTGGSGETLACVPSASCPSDLTTSKTCTSKVTTMA